MTLECQLEGVSCPVSTRCSDSDLAVSSEDWTTVDDEEDCRCRATTTTVTANNDDSRYQATTKSSALGWR